MPATLHPAHVTVSSVLRDLPDAPIASSRARDWGGVTLDLHAPMADYYVDTAAHDHHLICLCTKGSGRLIQRRDGKVHDSVIRAGATIIMPAGMPSVWEGTAAMSARIRMPREVLGSTSTQLGKGDAFELRNLFETFDPYLERLTSLMLIELDQPVHPAQHLILDSISTAMSAHLWRSYNGFALREEAADRTLAPASIRRVLDFIQEQLERPLALRELAGVANTSQFHFVRQFKKATGASPAAYIQAARIEWAKQLIAAGNLALSEIALIVGFADQSHFTRRFRHHAGATPGAYARDLGRTIS